MLRAYLWNRKIFVGRLVIKMMKQWQYNIACTKIRKNKKAFWFSLKFGVKLNKVIEGFNFMACYFDINLVQSRWLIRHCVFAS